MAEIIWLGNLQVVKMLAEIPESKAALENVNVFKKAWVDQVWKKGNDG